MPSSRVYSRLNARFFVLSEQIKQHQLLNICGGQQLHRAAGWLSLHVCPRVSAEDLSLPAGHLPMSTDKLWMSTHSNN